MTSAQAAAPIAAATSDTERALSRLRERCVAYYPDQATPTVRLVEARRRPQSLLLRCELKAGDESHRVIVKIPTAASTLGPAAGDIPRVAPLPDPRLKPRMEYLALKQIREHLTAMSDPRFGAIRVLDLWADTNATVMEEVPGTSLRAQLNRATRLQPHSEGILPACETLGAWLAQFQKLKPHELCRPRATTREEFLESIARMTEFLVSRTDQASLLKSAEHTLRAAARDRLPDALPLGLAHGDFAPRNVLVDPARKITVIDTLARFQAPVYEDLGYFLNDLHTARLQTCTVGAAFSNCFLEECRKALVRGWSQNVEDHRTVSLFEAQALLDRWCARAGGNSIGRAEFFLTRMHFSRRLRHLCTELTESA